MCVYVRGVLPDFIFCYLFPVQQTTSGIVHRVKAFFRVGNQYAECEKQETFMGWLDTPPFVSGLNAWIVVFRFEHEEYLEAVDLTSYVGISPTWLASYFLVRSSTSLRLLSGE